MGEYILILFAAVALFVFILIVSLIKRYKRCPSDRILVVYGKVGKGVESESMGVLPLSGQLFRIMHSLI